MKRKKTRTGHFLALVEIRYNENILSLKSNPPIDVLLAGMDLRCCMSMYVSFILSHLLTRFIGLAPREVEATRTDLLSIHFSTETLPSCRTNCHKTLFISQQFLVNGNFQFQSSFAVARELDQDPVKFHNFYRMSIESFKILLQIVGPEIRKKDTNFRKAVTVEETSDNIKVRNNFIL
jgi:hypothetical protein